MSVVHLTKQNDMRAYFDVQARYGYAILVFDSQ